MQDSINILNLDLLEQLLSKSAFFKKALSLPQFSNKNINFSKKIIDVVSATQTVNYLTSERTIDSLVNYTREYYNSLLERKYSYFIETHNFFQTDLFKILNNDGMSIKNFVDTTNIENCLFCSASMKETKDTNIFYCTVPILGYSKKKDSENNLEDLYLVKGGILLYDSVVVCEKCASSRYLNKRMILRESRYYPMQQLNSLDAIADFFVFYTALDCLLPSILKTTIAIL